MAIGDASYALYLVHPFAIRGLGALVRRLDLAPILGGWGFVALALAAAAAPAVHRLVRAAGDGVGADAARALD